VCHEPYTHRRTDTTQNQKLIPDDQILQGFKRFLPQSGTYRFYPTTHTFHTRLLKKSLKVS